MLPLIITLSIVVLDQLTKLAIVLNLLPGQTITVFPRFFQIAYVRNTGAVWGIFAGGNSWLIVVSFVIILLIVIFRKHFVTDYLLQRIAAGLMMGGIVGNLADRIKYGHVVDFLDFYAGRSHFPAFNVADSAICTGVGLYIVSQIIIERRERKRSSEAAISAT